MTSRSEPNCLRREGMRIFASAPAGSRGGSILEALRPPTNEDDADEVEAVCVCVLSGGLSPTPAWSPPPPPLPQGGFSSRSDGVDPATGSSPKSAEMELTRDSEVISGDVGGANPVMQSMTSTRDGRGVEEALLLGEGSTGLAPTSSSRVALDFFKSSVKWMAVYE